MSNYKISIIQNGRRVSVNSALEEFTFAGVEIQDLKILKVGGQLSLQGPVTIGPAVAPTDAVQKSQVDSLQALINAALANIVTVEEALAAVNVVLAEKCGEIDRLDCELVYLQGNRAVEDTQTAGVGGQTFFTSTLTWENDNTVTDLQVFIEDGKQRQDLAGGLDEAYRKLNSNDIEFSETIPEGDKITFRLEGDRFVNPKPPNPFFREYNVGSDLLQVSTISEFDLATGKLGVYRNGVYGAQSPFIGPVANRYAESMRDEVTFGTPPTPDEWLAFYHLDPIKDGAPLFKITVTGLAGTVIPVPTHIMGDDHFRVYRNGLLMNRVVKGPTALHYTDTSTVSITVADGATSDEYWTFEVYAVTPAWREDLDGIVGVDVNFTVPNVYTIGDKRLQIFKDGALEVDSLILGAVGQQYIENGINCIQLQSAIGIDTVITAIYLPV